MTVSIIIPVYNVEPYLARALDSTINQTYKDLEIICVDDCSTDNSLNILKEYAAKDKRIKIIERKENRGQGIARNQAIDIANGEYIMFLDPDDYYELNAVENALKRITETNADVTFFNFKKHTSGSIKIPNRYSKDKYKNVMNNKDDVVPYIAYCTLKIYNTDFIKKNNCKFASGKINEDGIFAVMVTCCADRISFLNEALYNYIKYDENSSPNRKAIVEYRKKNYKELLMNRKIAYEYVFHSDKAGNYMLTYLKSYINRIIVIGLNPKLYLPKKMDEKKKIYKIIRELFLEVNKNHDIKAIKNEFLYSEFMDIIKIKNYPLFVFKTKFLNKIFSFRCIKNKRIITILGIKIKYKIKDI